jgi:hypothetical protein
MSKHSKTQPARESPDEMHPRRAVETAHGAGHSDYITYEEFLDLVDEDTLAEWVDPILCRCCLRLIATPLASTCRSSYGKPACEAG